MFCLLSVFAIVQMLVLYTYDGLSYLDTISFYALTSLGNIGFSSSICARHIMDWDNGQTGIRLGFQC